MNKHANSCPHTIKLMLGSAVAGTASVLANNPIDNLKTNM